MEKLDFPIKTLIIDDLEDNRELLRMDLEDEIDDITVVEASGGLEGLKEMEKEEYTIVICDLMMPGMDGFTVFEKSRELRQNNEVPFIFLSANKQKEVAENALKIGAIDFLTKPYELTELIYKVKNLSRIKHLYDSLNRSKNQLEQTNRHLQILNEEKDDVLRIVSHDMRNPLSTIIGLASILKEDGIESHEEVVEMATIIERNGENLLNLVNLLLDVARLESGTIRIERRKVELHSFLRSQLENSSVLASRKQLEVELKSQQDVIYAMVDEPKLEQIIGNLFSNAIKFTPAGGKITMVISKEKDDVMIQVADTGIGIPKDMLPEIFKKFGGYQRSGTANEKGTGLGLSIVKRFVELHNGEIKVSSEPDRGTCFTIRLPDVVVS